MYFVSATRLKLISFRYLPGFMSVNGASVKQLRITAGFRMGKELIDKGLTFWTLTLWEKDTDMKSFRNSEPHRRAMQKLPEWCNEATYAHWLQEEPVLPAWDVVYKRMIKEGLVSKLRNPSELHPAKLFPPIKWTKAERKFNPVK